MIHIKDGLRFNIYSLRGKRDANGVLRKDYPNAQDLIDLGITEAPEPDQPADYSPDTYDRRELDAAPYVTYERKSDEQIAELNLAKAKQSRTAAVEQITVTTTSGNTYDGDEKSQDRMARAVACMDDGDVIPWVLSDNTIIQASRFELKEALKRAGAAMAAEWVKPYSAA